MSSETRPRMLDTNVFNKLLDGELSTAALTGQLLITGVQKAELKATSNVERRTALLSIVEEVNPSLQPAASFSWDIEGAGWNEAYWNDGTGKFESMLERLKELDLKSGKKMKDPRNQMRDVLIAETAIKLDAILVTNDRNLQTVISEFGGCYTELRQTAAIEMAYPQKMVEQIIIGLADPINNHLAKLTAFNFRAELRQHFQRELRTWLKKIQIMRLKPTMRTGSARFYFNLLFDYPFGGIEIQNTRALIEFISSEYDDIQPTKTPEELVDWLKRFHTELAERLHNAEPVLDMIPE